MINRLREKFNIGEWNTLSFITFILAIVGLIPAFIIHPQGTGVDLSYMQALDWVYNHRTNIKFGTDIAYSYGPLGFLCYKVATNWQLYLYILIFDIYVLINCVIILKAFMPVKSLLGAAVVFLTVYFLAKIFSESFCYVIFLFSVFTFFQTKNYWYLINAIFISVLSFFIKVNFGLLQLFALFVVFLYIFFNERKQRRLQLAILLAALLAFLGLCVVLKVDVIAYIISSFYVITGYNEANIIPVPLTSVKLLLASAILVAYNVIACYYIYRDRFRVEPILRYLFTDLFLFMSFKHAFVLNTDLNVYHHFSITVPVLGIQYLFESETYKKRLKELAVVGLLFTAPLFFALTPTFCKDHVRQYLSIDFFQDLTSRVKEKFVFTNEATKNRIFPERILKKIGNGSVDLKGFNLSLLFINGLNYMPRPGLQSYTSYNTYLDSMNCKKYLSSSGPDFVIFSGTNWGTFWQESITERVLSQCYTVIDSFYVDDCSEDFDREEHIEMLKYLLLERNKRPRVASTTNINAGEITLNEKFMADTGKIPQYLFADVEYTLVGQIKKLLFQPTLLYVTLGFENGKEASFRAVVPILKTGVLINKSVNNTDEADVFFRTNGQGNGRIKWIKFVPRDNFSFKNKIKYHTELISYSGN